MAADFRRVETMLDRLEREEFTSPCSAGSPRENPHSATPCSGRDAFAVGVLHGTTTEADAARLDEASSAGLVLIDTPGINELGGEAREKLAFEVAEVSDLIVFVADGDLTREERDALRTLASTRRPLLLALNKADRYSDEEREGLLERLRQHAAGLVRRDDVHRRRCTTGATRGDRRRRGRARHRRPTARPPMSAP